jgi:uncharacterized protein YbjT (DUF2867 family)
MKEILIKGATGYVGKALIETFKNQTLSFKAAVRDIETASSKLVIEKRLVVYDFTKPDIARVAAKVLTEDGHTQKEYELTGPKCLAISMPLLSLVKFWVNLFFILTPQRKILSVH